FHAEVRTDRLIGRMLRAGGTRMVGQDAQTRPDWKPLLDLVVWRAGSGDDAVFLIRAAHYILAQYLAVFQADEPIAEVVLLALCAAVAAHCHPPSVHDGPAFLALMADHSGQYAQCDLGCVGNADVMHDEIEHHIDACPHFRHAFQMLGSQRGRSRSDAHDVTRQARRTKALSGAHAARTFLFGNAHQFVMRIVVVTGARMGNYAPEVHAALR